MIKYVFIQQCAKFHEKISIFGVDFDQYFYVSIDFVLSKSAPKIKGDRNPNNKYGLSERAL